WNRRFLWSGLSRARRADVVAPPDRDCCRVGFRMARRRGFLSADRPRRAGIGRWQATGPCGRALGLAGSPPGAVSGRDSGPSGRGPASIGASPASTGGRDSVWSLFGDGGGRDAVLEPMAVDNSLASVLSADFL